MIFAYDILMAKKKSAAETVEGIRRAFLLWDARDEGKDDAAEDEGGCRIAF